jgi:hypothetical protein
VHLPAAGLLERKLDGLPESLQQLNGRAPRIREQRIDQARREERDSQQ